MAVLAVALTVTACSGSRAGGALVLDGRPRPPDEEGVIQEVSRTRLVLDGGRAYRITPSLQAFSTQTLQAVPILGREGQFVHVGTKGATAVWIATVADVFPGDPPVAYYTGTLDDVQGDRVAFRDGTVLRLGPGVRPPPGAGFVQVEIDPVAHVVRRLSSP